MFVVSAAAASVEDTAAEARDVVAVAIPAVGAAAVEDVAAENS